MTNAYLRNACAKGRPERPVWSIRTAAAHALSGAIATAFVATLASCGPVKASKPIYPAPSGAHASTLGFGNQISNSPWGFFVICMEVAIDGFSPTETKYLPTGNTSMQLLPGSHEMTINALLGCGNGQYYFNPIRVAFETAPGKSYTINLEGIPTMMKPGYRLDYRGWSTEQTAGWPSEIYIANPLFGAMPPSGGEA